MYLGGLCLHHRVLGRIVLLSDGLVLLCTLKVSRWHHLTGRTFIHINHTWLLHGLRGNSNRWYHWWYYCTWLRHHRNILNSLFTGGILLIGQHRWIVLPNFTHQRILGRESNSRLRQFVLGSVGRVILVL